MAHLRRRSSFINKGDGVPRNGLVAEYLANNNFLDTSGNGFNGVNNNVTFGNDRKSSANSAFALNGIDAFVDINTSIASLQTTTTGTWSAWINPNFVISNTTILAYGDSIQGQKIELNKTTTGVIQANILLGSVQWSLQTDSLHAPDGVWINIILVQDGISPEIFINGVTVAQTFLTSTDKTFWFNNLSGFGGLDSNRIGCTNFNSQGNTSFFDGSIDDIRIYDRVLTQEEITILANE